MASVETWERRLSKLGLDLRVLERENDGSDGVVKSWLVFVCPRGLPQEPMFFPPVGCGSNVERELAIRAAVEMYSMKESGLTPPARAYFERFFGGALPRFDENE